MNKLKVLSIGHSDMGIDGNFSYEGSLSPGGFRNTSIRMKYSSIPNFLYLLSKPLNNFDFLDETEKREILNCERISFASTFYQEPKTLSEKLDGDANHYRIFWEGQYERDGEIYRYDDKDLLEHYRKSFEILPIIKKMEELDIDKEKIEFVGTVEGSPEYQSRIHILFSDDRKTYISQYWGGEGLNLLRTKEEDTKYLVKDIVRYNGTAVSGALRSLLEK